MCVRVLSPQLDNRFLGGRDQAFSSCTWLVLNKHQADISFFSNHSLAVFSHLPKVHQAPGPTSIFTVLKCHIYWLVWFLCALVSASGYRPVWFDCVLLAQGTDSGGQYMFVKITGSHAFGAENQKLLGQKMSEDVWSREKWPVCFPVWPTVHTEHALCHMNISCWRDMKKSLIPPRLVCSGSGCSVPTSGLHYFLPTPISLYLRKRCQENKVPQDCLLIKG